MANKIYKRANPKKIRRVFKKFAKSFNPPLNIELEFCPYPFDELYVVVIRLPTKNVEDEDDPCGYGSLSDTLMAFDPRFKSYWVTRNRQKQGSIHFRIEQCEFNKSKRKWTPKQFKKSKKKWCVPKRI